MLKLKFYFFLIGNNLFTKIVEFIFGVCVDVCLIEELGRLMWHSVRFLVIL